MGLITTLTATVKGRAFCQAAAATSPASYAAVPAARSSRRASGSALQPLDPAMLGRELVIVVVDVPTSSPAKCGPMIRSRVESSAFGAVV